MYVMTAMTLNERLGIEQLKKALDVLDEVIKSKGGRMEIKNEVRLRICIDCSLVWPIRKKMPIWREC